MEFHYEFVNPDYLLVNLNYLESTDAFTFTRNMLPHAKMIKTFSQASIYAPILPQNNMPSEAEYPLIPFKNFSIDFDEVGFFVNTLRYLPLDEPTVVFVQIPDKKYVSMKKNEDKKESTPQQIQEDVD